MAVKFLNGLNCFGELRFKAMQPAEPRDQDLDHGLWIAGQSLRALPWFNEIKEDLAKLLQSYAKP